MNLYQTPAPPVDSSEWREEALCAQVGWDLFFIEKGGSAAPGKQVCRQCPVIVECLAWAVRVQEPHGTWGGMSPRQRMKLWDDKHLGEAS